MNKRFCVQVVPCQQYHKFNPSGIFHGSVNIASGWMGQISIIVEGLAQLTGMLVLGHADIYYLWGDSKRHHLLISAGPDLKIRVKYVTYEIFHKRANELKLIQICPRGNPLTMQKRIATTILHRVHLWLLKLWPTSPGQKIRWWSCTEKTIPTDVQNPQM